MAYLINVLIGVDQLATTLVGGFPDETLSSYAYRLEQKGRLAGRIFRPFIDWLFAWQKLPGGHCYDSWRDEVRQAEMPPEIRLHTLNPPV